MSKRHQVRRRRSYGRRQHELHELHERMNPLVAVMDWLDESADGETTYIWDREPAARERGAALLAPQGVD
jgi:hypothetical protein